MPIVGDYDTSLMDEDTVPLQYIKMPADEHIPLHYLGTTIQDNTDLEQLYLKTAEFFSSEWAVEDEDEVENSTACDDAPKPISENDSSKEGSGSDPTTESNPPLTAAFVRSQEW